MRPNHIKSIQVGDVLLYVRLHFSGVVIVLLNIGRLKYCSQHTHTKQVLTTQTHERKVEISSLKYGLVYTLQ